MVVPAPLHIRHPQQILRNLVSHFLRGTKPAELNGAINLTVVLTPFAVRPASVCFCYPQEISFWNTTQFPLPPGNTGVRVNIR